MKAIKAAVWASIVVAGSAWGQSLPTYNLERLTLNPGAEESLVAGTGALMPEGRFRFSALGRYASGVSLFREGTSATVGWVDRRITGHVTVAYAPISWFQVGLDAPYILTQSAPSLPALYGIAEPARTGLGQVAASGRIGVLSVREGMPLNLAVELGVGLPVGDRAALGRDDRISLIPRLQLGRDFGAFGLGAELWAYWRRGHGFTPITRRPNDTFGSEVGASVSLNAELADGLRAELDAILSVPKTHPALGVQLFAGARYAIADTLEIFVLGGPGFGPLVALPQWSALLGIGVSGGGAPSAARTPAPAKDACADISSRPASECPDHDDDRDGITNRYDRCATKAEDRDGFEDADGCVDPDDDLDGVMDSADACPKQPGSSANGGCPPKNDDTDRDGLLDARDACPKDPGPATNRGCPLRDADKDGVSDDLDACPNEAGPSTGKGCPARDADQDGLLDAEDECPNEAGPKVSRGCPVKDADKDGVNDAQDSCIRLKGTAKNFGCPPKRKQPVQITSERLVLHRPLTFAPSKSALAKTSNAVLSEVARILTEHPEITQLTIEVHTGEAGDPEKNRKLSQARADAVRIFLILQGVKAPRLSAKGAGGDKPASPTTGAKGRAASNRVELLIDRGT